MGLITSFSWLSTLLETSADLLTWGAFIVEKENQGNSSKTHVTCGQASLCRKI